MHGLFHLVIFVPLFLSGCSSEPITLSPIEYSPKPDWMTWRGPYGNGIASPGQTPPMEWSEDKNVRWKAEVPGKGHSSPTIVGDQVILTTSDVDAETQSIVSFDRKSGTKRWETVINEGNFPARIHQKNTHASPTAVTDGKRIYAMFNNNESVQIAVLDMKGDLVWKKVAAPYKPRFPFGFAPSPLLYKDTVIVTSECERVGVMVAFDTKTGDEKWRADRNKASSYSSPVVGQVDGKDQLLISGANSIASYDPNDGSENWNVDGPWLVTCGTLVWNEQMVFASGGYPGGGTLGIRVTGSPKVVWQNRVKCYEQSMLYHDGFVYGMSDIGVVYCWDATDGTEMWNERLSGPVSASPVLAGDHVYISVEDGKTYVFQPNPDKFELVATNQLGNSAFATPSFVDNQIFARVAHREDGKRQEWLYCLEKE